MVVGDVFNCDIKRPSDATFVPFEVVRRVLNDWCARAVTCVIDRSVRQSVGAEGGFTFTHAGGPRWFRWRRRRRRSFLWGSQRRDDDRAAEAEPMFT